MKRILLTIFLFLCCTGAFSRHIKGGFFNYQYLGAGISNPTFSRYKITLTIYMDCDANGNQIDNSVNFTVFNGTNFSQYDNVSVVKDDSYLLRKLYDDPCISGDQAICYYRIVTYVLPSYELPDAINGYTISFQRCCRIENMDNIAGSGNIGNTYTIQIPGTSNSLPNITHNSSPNFPIDDTVVICEKNYFSYPFSATDPNGDSLSYAFCTSYSGGGQATPAPEYASTPPYKPVPYFTDFSGATPLGIGVTINAKTGLISGTGPTIVNTGEYAVTVCVSEFRNGIFIEQTRKELHIRVKNCSVTRAFLNPIPTTCDGFTVKFSNNAINPSGIDYVWTFGEPLSGSGNSSTEATPSHTYSDTGIYTLKLRVSLAGLCADSTTAPVKVYPGFFPGFVANAPLCKGAPVSFIDTSKTKYGITTGWRWNFNNQKDAGDTSTLQNPLYTFPDFGTYHVQFIVGNTFGCLDTVKNDIIIHDKPVINLIPRDTLICYIDTLQIKTNNTGSFSWSPNYNINSLTSANPLVSPDVPTKYFVTLTDLFGCINTDSVFVNVVNKVTINAGKDSTICRTDGVMLNTTSNALQYSWTPAIYLSSAIVKNPLANPLVAAITYTVTGSIGKCKDSSTVTIRTLPYPPAYAGRDTTVCFGFSAQLMASGGRTYQWSPATFLSAANIPDPVVIRPAVTTQYIVAVTDVTGCLKPAFDTVMVNVDALIIADAGPADTTVVLGEPLYLLGSGGATYSWTPATWLSNPSIANPVSLPENNITYHLLVTSKAGCQQSDSIRIKLYKVPPSFYVPTAFTPNNDQHNDNLKPILLGMRSLNYFRVYDRWGKLLFNTSQKGQGWDGTLRGNPQDAGTYVWMAAGATFTGEIIVRKGYAVLIR